MVTKRNARGETSPCREVRSGSQGPQRGGEHRAGRLSTDLGGEHRPGRSDARRDAHSSASRGRDSEDRRDSGERPSAAKRRRWPWVVALSAFLVVVLVVGVFSWNRWFAFDDAHDIQGSWQVVGTTVYISVDADAIRITDDVAYSYSLDSGGKSLSLSFGEYSGGGHYWFSLDRQTLVFADGAATGIGSLSGDIVLTWDDLVSSIQGKAPALPSGENTVVLKRVSASAS